MTTPTTMEKKFLKYTALNKLDRLLLEQLEAASAEKMRQFVEYGTTLKDLEAAAVEYLKDYEGKPWNIVDESEALIILDYYEDGRYTVITTAGELGQIYGENLRTLCK